MAGFTHFSTGATLLAVAFGAAQLLQDPLRPLPADAAVTTATQWNQETADANVRLIDVGATLIANIDDPEAVNVQSVCPGYKTSNVLHTSSGFTASLELAGEPCNVYGTDVGSLTLEVCPP
jgi:alpha-glucosidase